MAMNTAMDPAAGGMRLVAERSEALTAWRTDMRQRVEAILDAVTDRESQMDARRQVAGLQRAESALQACLARRNGTRTDPAVPCAVIVHRSSWMRERVAACLQERGVALVGTAEDGATALGLALVEQPDALLMEARLPWLAPLDVVRDVRQFCPSTVIALQAETSNAREQLLAAGAAVVYTRDTPPAELAADLAARLAG